MLKVGHGREKTGIIFSHGHSPFFQSFMGFWAGFSSNIRLPIVSTRVLIRRHVVRYRSLKASDPSFSSRYFSVTDLLRKRSPRLFRSSSVIFSFAQISSRVSTPLFSSARRHR